MATRLYLIRHGATILSAEDRFAGSTDAPLSDEGRDQAARLSERLRTVEVAAIYCSPMQRTRETARILAAPHQLQVGELSELREICHGHWEGKSRAEVEREFPQETQSWERDPFTYAPPGGESGLQVTARALPVVLGLVQRHPERSVAIVSHKATIRLLLSFLLGFDPRRYRDHLDQSPAALNIVDFKDPSRARLTLFNDTSHYTLPRSPVPAVPGARLSQWWNSDDL